MIQKLLNIANNRYNILVKHNKKICFLEKVLPKYSTEKNSLYSIIIITLSTILNKINKLNDLIFKLYYINNIYKKILRKQIYLNELWTGLGILGEQNKSLKIFFLENKINNVPISILLYQQCNTKIDEFIYFIQKYLFQLELQVDNMIYICENKNINVGNYINLILELNECCRININIIDIHSIDQEHFYNFIKSILKS